MSETASEPVDAPRVLVIDDASLVRMYYRSALERAGFVVDEALNGIEGLERVLTTTYDLLVVDVNMPKMDGFSFLHTLRGREPMVRSIPVLMTSTEAGDGDREAARAVGANFYLVKPLPEGVLVAYARALAGRRP
ncbi:response regulator transcription factor [Methylobacterium gnaphalii]|uniref:Response regulator n=1 Tax=Methylobacterium gnaphalii TaxID=1010610 RepID=A0A512JQG7_9HYPH|nr:response regulator [Methylobacterium gnaphalii]GEP12206.1 response regulator [Methylobacterium gnaphalii]GJD67456.1 Chemotaxis protein CheY [Methylobacterium gnaphalii]GLS51328.1 response regulator [Methylobacterium gnaphalii]